MTRFAIALLLALAAVVASAGWLYSISQQSTFTDSRAAAQPAGAELSPAQASLDPAGPGLSNSEKSIAILPFMLRAGARDDTRLAVASVHESLAWRLSSVRALKTIAPDSTRHFRSAGAAPAQIGAELGANFILEGVIEQQGVVLRAGAQLIHAGSGNSLWSGSWDGSAGAALWFRIESEIARAVTDRLDVELTTQQARALNRIPTGHDAAWLEYLEATRPGSPGAPLNLEQVQHHLLESVRLDPRYADAWAELGLTLMINLGQGAQQSGATVEQALEAIEQALKIDPGHARAWAALGYFRRVQGLPDADQAFKTAVDLNPGDVRTLSLLGESLLDAGRPQAAEAHFRQVTELNPLAPAAWFALGRSRDRQGQYDRAREAFERLRELSPDSPLGFVSTGMGLLAQGRLDEAIYWMDRAWRASPGNVEVAAWMLRLHDSLQDYRSADSWARWLAGHVTRQTFPLAMLARHAYLGGGFQTALQFANLTSRLGLEGRADAQSVFLRIKRDEALVYTDPASGIRLFGQAHPELFETPPVVDDENLPSAVNLSLLLKLTGDDEGALALSREILREIERPFTLSGSNRAAWQPLKAEILAVIGQEQDAISALQQAVEGGWRLDWYWATELNAAFNGIRDSAAFREIIDGLASEAAFQRAQVESMRRSGEIGPTP